MSKSKIAVVYASYSSHRQGEQSIEAQLAEAYKYAAAHGLKIIHELKLKVKFHFEKPTKVTGS